MTTYHFINLATVLTLSLATGCSSESPIGDLGRGSVPAEIIASIGQAPVVETKATAGNGDNISYETFAAGDEIGFFSITGLTADNEKLAYSGGSFKSTGGDDALIWKEGTAQRVYAYYPYSASAAVNTSEYPVSIWRAADAGKWKDGFEDFLAASANNISNGSLISLGFSHQFAMLIVKRGVGFETNTSDVTLRLNYPLAKTANISRKDWNTALLLQADEAAGVSELTGNAGTYQPAGSTGAAEPCSYAIVPVGDVYQAGVKQPERAQVVSLTLENNAGRPMTIALPAALGSFQANTKYLLMVRMRDNQAVIEPEEIRRWEEVPIAITKPAGIETAAAFNVWMATYNDPAASDRLDILARYGTYDAASGKWTFLILSDFTYTPATSVQPSAVITDFSDRLDGQGHTISHLTLHGAPRSGFFGTLSGEVKNLTLSDIQVEKDAAPTPAHYGALAAEVTATGRIDCCHVTGDASLIVGGGSTGGLVGTLQAGASLTNCTSTAVVAGEAPATTGLLAGQNNGGTLSGCTSTGTLITTN